MKILFYTSCKAIAMKGGTERATVSVASALSSRYGHECYSAYSIEDSAPKELCFAGELMVDGHLKTAASQIASFVQDRRVDVVVSQGSFELVIALRKAGLPRCTKLVLAHHFEPGWEVHFGDLRTCLSQLGSASGTGKVKPAVMVLCYPIYKARYTRRLRGDYQAAYMAADAVVLLSEGFSEGYKAFGGLEDVEKFRFIPNPLSCEEYLDPAAYCEKKKIALIVARLEDTPKKISLALKAWEAVKSDPVSEGWTLRIVGHGRDESRYKRLAARMRLPDVDFVGRRDPIEGGGLLHSVPVPDDFGKRRMGSDVDGGAAVRGSARRVRFLRLASRDHNRWGKRQIRSLCGCKRLCKSRARTHGGCWHAAGNGSVRHRVFQAFLLGSDC